MKISIKENLKAVMKQRNVTQMELAEGLEISQSAIAAYCTGRKVPNLERLVQICTYLNVSADYLLGLSITGGGRFLYRKQMKGSLPSNAFIFSHWAPLQQAHTGAQAYTYVYIRTHEHAHARKYVRARAHTYIYKLYVKENRA